MCHKFGGSVLSLETANRCMCCCLGLAFFLLAISVYPSPLELSEVVHHVLGTCVCWCFRTLWCIAVFCVHRWVVPPKKVRHNKKTVQGRPNVANLRPIIGIPFEASGLLHPTPSVLVTVQVERRGSRKTTGLPQHVHHPVDLSIHGMRVALAGRARQEQGVILDGADKHALSGRPALSILSPSNPHPLHQCAP